MSEEIRRPRPPGGTSGESPEKPKRTVEFLIAGEVKSFDRDSVMEDMGVVDIVRMQADDFANIDPSPGWQYLHLNYEFTVNRPAAEGEPERRYLIAKIVGPGQPEPLLTLDGALLAECLESGSNVAYEDLTDEQLALSLPGLRDRASALATMQKRYGYGSSRGRSPEEVAKAGVGYTLFRILGPAPASNIAR